MRVMPHSLSSVSVILPLRPKDETSTSMRWLSVPPVSTGTPSLMNSSAMAFEFFTIWAAYSLYSGESASVKHTDLAAITWGSGPPITSGQPLSTASANSSLQRIMPPRGPRSVLWVVVVTTSAQGNGENSPVNTPPATRPEKWAMSTMKTAPTLWAISERVRKLIALG